MIIIIIIIKIKIIIVMMIIIINMHICIAHFNKVSEGQNLKHKSRNQTTSYAIENKYCFKRSLNWPLIKLMFLRVIGSEFLGTGSCGGQSNKLIVIWSKTRSLCDYVDYSFRKSRTAICALIKIYTYNKLVLINILYFHLKFYITS